MFIKTIYKYIAEFTQVFRKELFDLIYIAETFHSEAQNLHSSSKF